MTFIVRRTAGRLASIGESAAVAGFWILVVLPLTLFLLGLLWWGVGSMAVVTGEQFGWWELGWVSDPNDSAGC